MDPLEKAAAELGGSPIGEEREQEVIEEQEVAEDPLSQKAAELGGVAVSDPFAVDEGFSPLRWFEDKKEEVKSAISEFLERQGLPTPFEEESLEQVLTSDTAEKIFAGLDVPSQVERQIIKAGMRKEDILKEAIKPFTEFPKEDVPPFGEIVEEAQVSAGIPREFAREAGQIVDLPVTMVADPLNALDFVPGLTLGKGGIINRAAKSIPIKVDDVIALAGKTKQLTDAAGRKTMAMFFGVPDKSWKKVMDVYKSGKKVYDIGELKDAVDTAVRAIREARSEALSNIKSLEAARKEAEIFSVSRLKDKGRAPDLTNRIVNSTDMLKEEIGALSSNGYDLLDTTEGFIDTKIMKDFVDQTIEDLTPLGKAGIEQELTPFGAKARQLLNEFQTIWKPNLEKFPDQISFMEAKKILSQIDPDLNFGFGFAEFNPVEQKVKKNFRKLVRSELGALVPGYDNVMSEISRKSDVIDQISSVFGKEERIPGILQRVVENKAPQVNSAIKLLGDEIGEDIIGDLTVFRNSNEILKDKFKLNRYINKELSDIDQVILDAEGDFEIWDQKANSIAGLTPDTTQSKLEKVGRHDRGRNIELERKLDLIAEETGIDFIEEATIAEAFRDFDKTDVRGSRRTNWMSRAGGAAAKAVAAGAFGGTVAGEMGAAVGAALGGLAGMYTDIMGPEMAGRMLRQWSKTRAFKNNVKSIIAISGKESELLKAGKKGFKVAERILALPGVARQFAEELIDPDSSTVTQGHLSINDPATINEIRGEIARDRDIDSETRLEMINSISERGEVDIFLMPAEPTEEGQKDKRVNKMINDGTSALDIALRRIK